MKKLTLLLALASVMAGATAAAQTPVMQAHSFASYAALPVAQREAYVAGVLDADRSMVPFEQAHAKFARCLAGTTIGQLTVLVDARVNHPVLMDNGYVPLAVHNALDADCTRRGFQP
ncbi:hypothetical protein [Burkholderia ubonensis]|uniref:hypothetical protein n=1 Tax=Burkholderia ubonensis TaxID=101571 RepID=UPI0018DF55B1|nr:hypothetical protein [Burkholderia ubonensis]